jgi:hypothetical protein
MRNVWGSCRRPRPEALVVCCAGDSGCRLNRDHDYPVEILGAVESTRSRRRAEQVTLTSVAAPQPSAACTRLHREDTRVVIWISLVLEPNTPGDTRGSRAGRAAGDRDGSGDRSNPTHANTGRPSVNREHSSGARSPSPVLSPRGNGIACRNATPEG